MRPTILRRLRAGVWPAALLTLLVPRVAHAQLTFALDNPQQFAYVGNSVPFTGTLTNNGTSDVYLNTVSFTPDQPWTGVTLNENPFYDTMPTLLAPGDSASGELFDLELDPSTAAGIYSGTFTINGGADLNAEDALATQPFRVTAAIPEPSSAWLLGLGLPALAVAVRRRRAGA